MVSRQPVKTASFPRDSYQHEVVFSPPIRFARLGKDCYGQGPGQEDDQALESVNVAFAFVLKGSWNFHGSEVEMAICPNRLEAWFDTKVEGHRFKVKRESS